MPIYEFECQTDGCNTPRTEVLMGIEADATPICPKCKVPMQKVMSVSSFRMFGQGVYKPNER